MKGKDITKMYYKGTTKQKSKQRQSKAFINFGLYKSEGAAETKRIMREFDPQYKHFRIEAIGIEHGFGARKIKKEQMLLTRDSKMSYYWKLSNR